MRGYLVESALLTHGIASISDRRLAEMWEGDWPVAWMDGGRPVTGGIEEFIEFRRRADGLKRINYFNYDRAAAGGSSGPLTASGTMRAAELLASEGVDSGRVCVVTCGIGGLRQGEPYDASNDISALKASSISMIAAAFKDMFDADYSINMAEKQGIKVRRLSDCWHRGYIFREKDSEDIRTAGIIPHYESSFFPGTLYLNPAPQQDLVADRSILSEAVNYGKTQAEAGLAFHPAVNRKIDELTGGYSSLLQLKALIENIRKAEQLGL